MKRFTTLADLILANLSSGQFVETYNQVGNDRLGARYYVEPSSYVPVPAEGDLTLPNGNHIRYVVGLSRDLVTKTGAIIDQSTGNTGNTLTERLNTMLVDIDAVEALSATNAGDIATLQASSDVELASGQVTGGVANFDLATIFSANPTYDFFKLAFSNIELDATNVAPGFRIFPFEDGVIDTNNNSMYWTRWRYDNTTDQDDQQLDDALDLEEQSSFIRGDLVLYVIRPHANAHEVRPMFKWKMLYNTYSNPFCGHVEGVGHYSGAASAVTGIRFACNPSFRTFKASTINYSVIGLRNLAL